MALWQRAATSAESMPPLSPTTNPRAPAAWARSRSQVAMVSARVMWKILTRVKVVSLGNTSHMMRRLLATLLLLALVAPWRPLQAYQSSARPRPETAVSLVGGRLAWGKLVLRMTVKEVE